MKSTMALCLSIFILFITAQANAAPRIKDIADIEGVRDNMLIGYGLVVGLNGTGDSLTKSIFTRESLIGMLDRLGVNARDSSLKTKNVAAVVVTANLPPFSRQGSKVDIQVSTIGDASSLQGGTLLVTPLLGADGEVYAIAQGALKVDGIDGSGKAVPTSAFVSNGGLIEKEIPFNFADLKTIKLALRNPDFTTSKRVADVVNTSIGIETARSVDPGTVELKLPYMFHDNPVGFITMVEQLTVQPDQAAKVLVDDKTGMVVMGQAVRINEVAIAHENLTVNVTSDEPAEPAPAVAAAPAPEGEEGAAPAGPEKKIAILESGVSLSELVEGLNALGISPRDLISILQGIKAAGALQADIEVM